jgi:flagellar M-ring protein FliF
MSGSLALAEPPSSRASSAWRLRLESIVAQPAVRRSWPLIAAVGALLAGLLLWSVLRSPDTRPVYPGLADADKAAVADALRTADFAVTIDPASGTVQVPAAQVAAARILLAGQGLPKAAPTGGTMLGTMPLGSSRAVEGAQLKLAAERDLAASIAAIDAVERAEVHLATPEASVFVRDRAAPTASVLVVLAAGRTLSDAQVRAVAHLVASAVPGLAPGAVSIVDQSGALLSGDDADLGESGRMLDVEARTAAQLRQRIVQLLTPIVGAANFTAQVTADLDFAETAATRESLAPGMLVSEQGSSATETPPAPARGIPGALSNTIPQAAQVSTMPPLTAAPTPPAPTGSTSFTRSYEVGKAVSVTRAARGTLRRLSVAVVVRDEALGAPKGRAARLATLTGLVRSAVGFDARRGDVVTLAAQGFVAGETSSVPAWWQAYLSGAGQGVLGLAGLAMLVFGLARPWLRARTAERLAVAETAAVPVALLDYDAKLAETRLLAGNDPARATAVLRGLLRAPA